MEPAAMIRGRSVVLLFLLVGAFWQCSTFASSKGQTIPVKAANPKSRAAEWAQALRMADFILSLQNSAGAISDRQGATTVNEDSNMEYALIGLGAAYEASGNERYLRGLEQGICWLAAREEMSDPKWKGSWRFAYSAKPPYSPIPTSPGDGLIDARGVDATSTLFVYLLYLDRRLTHSDQLARTYAANAQAALNFVIEHNLDRDGFSRSSWQQTASGHEWRMYSFKYSADQGDVYLGMEAGARLYRSEQYRKVAEFLKSSTPKLLFSTALGHYGLGLNEKNAFDPSEYVFAQGYLAWMWGDTPQDRAALEWLRSRVQSDGTIREPDAKQNFSLSVAMLGMADTALGQPEPTKSFQWLVSAPYDRSSGGVHEISVANSPEFSNVTGFCIISLLGFLPFE